MSSLTRVSSLGRFRSRRGVVSTPSTLASGYVSVQINKKSYGLHRLIAIAFELQRLPGQTTVDHINSNRSDNRLINLRWATNSEQVRHSYATNTKRKSLSKHVLGRRTGSTDEWTSFANAGDAARTLGVNKSSVRNCCNNSKQQRAGAFTFKYAAPTTEPDVLEGEEWRDVIITATN